MPPISVPGVMRVWVGEWVTGFLCLLPLFACAAGAQAKPTAASPTLAGREPPGGLFGPYLVVTIERLVAQGEVQRG